jgi:hypothetical protein
LVSVMAAVSEVMGRPWKWGEADCCAAACDVFLRLHGIDPMQPLRGVCASREEAGRVVGAMGGMIAMVDRLTAAAGLMPTDAPVAGDLGLTAERPEGRALCICVSPDRWAAKTARGYAIVSAAERAWTCRS